MILNKILTLILLIISMISFSQNNVCESSKVEFEELNTIGKCAIENFKKSKKQEFVKVSTRSRFVRKRTKMIADLRKKIPVKSSKKSLYKESTKRIIEASNVADNKLDLKSSEESLFNNFIKFDQVEEIPVFINCANYLPNVKQGCVKETFVNNILDNFVYPFDAASEGIEGRVWIRFIIDTNGYVKNVTASGPINGFLLEKEARRLVGLLPKFIPGKHNDEYVNVEYFMPIDFQLN